LKRNFVFGWFISILQSLSSVSLLATSAWLLSRADQRPSVMYLSLAVVGVRAFALGKAFFRYSERLVLHDATFRKATDVRTGIYSTLVDRAPIGLRDTSVGSLLTTMVDDTEESLNVDLRYRPALLQSIAVTVAGSAVYFWLVPQLAWIMLAVLLLGSTITYWGSKRNYGKNLIQLNALRSQLAELSENAVNRARVIRAYGWQERSNQKLDELAKAVSKAESQIARTTGLLQALIAGAMYATIAVALMVSLLSGTILPGEQVAVLVLLPLGIYEYLQALPNALQSKQKAGISIQRLAELESLSVPEQLVSKGNEKVSTFEKLELYNASVTYPNGKQVRLPDLNLKQGETITLEADSGAGKTTLAHVLVGFINPSNGSVLLNGRPIVSFEHNSLRQIFGLVEQQPNILAGTIRNNLLLAKPEASDQELVQVLKEVELWGMLSKREGLETQVGNSGSKLSGGEAQRLALARNFLADRQVIVLDEPTSSVQFTQGKTLIRQLLSQARERNCSVILITHEPKLAKMTDRLVKF